MTNLSTVTDKKSSTKLFTRLTLVLTLLALVSLSGCARGPRELFSQVFRGKQATAEDDQTVADADTNKSWSSKVKGWFSAEEDSLEDLLEDDPFLTGTDLVTTEQQESATQESNGAVALTSAEDLDKHGLKNASSEVESSLEDFLNSRKEELTESSEESLSAFGSSSIEDFENSKEELTKHLEGGEEKFDSAFDEEFARIGEEVKREQAQIAAEQEESFAALEKFKEFSSLSEGDEANPFAARDNEEDLQEESTSADEDVNPFEAINNKIAQAEELTEKPDFDPSSFSFETEEESNSDSTVEEETIDFGEPVEEFVSNLPANDQEFDDNWVNDEISATENLGENDFSNIGEQSWTGEDSNESNDSSFSTKANDDWVESQPVTPNRAYSGESGKMIFDSKSVPSRFMTPEEKQNWFRQTQNKAKPNLNHESMSVPFDSGTEIQTVAGTRLSTSFDFGKETAPVQTTQSVNLGTPEWDFEEDITGGNSTDSEPRLMATATAIDQNPYPLPELDHSEEFSGLHPIESNHSSNEMLPAVEWNDELTEAAVPVEATKDTAAKSKLPGRWIGIVISVAMILFLLRRRQTAPQTTAATLKK